MIQGRRAPLAMNLCPLRGRTQGNWKSSSLIPRLPLDADQLHDASRDVPVLDVEVAVLVPG